jgi:hypothetical protein
MIALLASTANSQIHRASSQNNYRLKYDANFTMHYFQRKVANLAELVAHQNESKIIDHFSFNTLYFNYNSDAFVWASVVLGTFMVGMCGVLPVFLLPRLIDGHQKLSESSVFKCLVSFAAGSLLGDVFLHLLPEAYSSKSTYLLC